VPVGATDPIQVDVRVIAATNRDLEREMETGSFREDLFYRLNVINIDVPPLRDRVEDIPLLAEHFLETKAAAVGEGESAPTRISSEAMEVLEAYRWPGNVRELENVIERAVVLCEGEEIGPEELPDRLTEPSPEPLVREERPDNPSLEVIEQAYIRHVLEAEDGNRTRAAEVLGIDPSTLYRKIKRYDLEV
ncbi:MAG: helix-turn-helix domain-containing protein, partial [Gemmatimonadota bacterium]